MTAHDYLKMWQASQVDPATAGNLYDQTVLERYQAVMAKIAPEYRSVMQENLEKWHATKAKYADRLPTPFQSLQDFERLMRAKRRIDATLQTVGQFKPIDNLVLGSIETEQLNAAASLMRDSNEYLIIFNRGLLLALLIASNFFVRATAMTMQPGPDGAVDRIVQDQLDRLAPDFAHLLRLVSAGQLPSTELARAMFPYPEREARWTKLEDVTMDFAFAHEYAHVLLGHLRGAGETASEDRGGWGQEYEADSIALDFVVETWLEEERKFAGTKDCNPLLLAFVLQGVCLFFVLLCQIEQYSAENCGKRTGIWRAAKTHPPSFIRWTRMLDKARGKTPPQLWAIVLPQVVTMEQFLSQLYAAAVGPPPLTPTALEWQFQRAAFAALRTHRLVPQHLVIACRCARAATARGSTLNEAEIAACAAAADAELEAAGARPLRDYCQPLGTVVTALSRQALQCQQILGAETVRSFADRLAAMFLLDARTRYPLPAPA